MTINDRVAGYIGFEPTVNTVPTLTQISQFAKDAIVDITNKSVLLFPQDQELFATTATAQYDPFHVKSGIVLTVMRETGTSGDFAVAKQIPMGRKSLVTNTDSIHYASKFSPVWYFDEASNQNRTVTVLPATSNNTGEKYNITQVGYNFYDEGGDIIAHGSDLDSDPLKYFPHNRQYLIPLYIAIRGLYLYIASEFKETSGLFSAGIANASTDSSVDTSSFAKWLSDEDTEMAQVTAQTQGAEGQFLMQYLQKLASLKQEYMEAFSLKMAQDKDKPQPQQG